MSKIYALYIGENLPMKKFDLLLKYVSYEKKQRLLKYHRIEDAQRSLLADILCRYDICNRLGLKNEELKFTKNQYGKPLLLGNNDIHFNLSHSGDWVVCAGDNSPIGIDVEVIKTMEFDIAERFFSKNEYEELLSIDKDERLEHFFKLWTLKESYIKAEGKGLYIDLNSFSVSAKNLNIYVSNSINRYFMNQMKLDENHILALCSCKEINMGNIIKYLDMDKFLEEAISTFEIKKY